MKKTALTIRVEERGEKVVLEEKRGQVSNAFEKSLTKRLGSQLL